jgi:hypothetical protein
MRFRKSWLAIPVVALVLTACATIPEGPSVAVMPGPGKPFEQFQVDDAVCRQFAHGQVGGNPNEVAGNQVVTGAVVGTALGAAAGALVGQGHGQPTSAFAGMGLLAGTAAGADAAGRTHMTLQRRYDVAYEQCMYAKGNQVPGFPAPQYVPPPPPPPSAPPPPEPAKP